MALTSRPIAVRGPVHLIEVVVTYDVERYGRVVGQSTARLYDVWCDTCDDFAAQAVNATEGEAEYATHAH